MSDLILTINAGSSSVKFALFELGDGEPELTAKGKVEGIGTAPHFLVKNARGDLLAESYWEPVSGGRGHTVAFQQIGRWLEEATQGGTIVAVGHRVAHGGEQYSRPVFLDDSVIAYLNGLIPLVPLHLPHNLASIKAVAMNQPDLPQVACFDTSFHQQRPAESERFGLPYTFYERGIRRYGFHGISYEYILKRFGELEPELSQGRIIVAHLGSGCSMCAIHQGKSMDTTMSFSALDGLPMGTRCGALDPGVLLYLLRQEGLGVDELENLLYKDSGLLGISGVSNDMRDLWESDDPRAKDAIDYFVFRVCQFLGALTASMGGLDALIFTAGIGENDPAIRESVCRQAGWLGITLDTEANERQDLKVSTETNTPSVWAIPTDEERMIALHTATMLKDASPDILKTVGSDSH